jgi:hypothetical protein
MQQTMLPQQRTPTAPFTQTTPIRPVSSPGAAPQPATAKPTSPGTTKDDDDFQIERF